MNTVWFVHVARHCMVRCAAYFCPCAIDTEMARCSLQYAVHARAQAHNTTHKVGSRPRRCYHTVTELVELQVLLNVLSKMSAIPNCGGGC